MITPAEIKERCLKQWKTVLINTILNTLKNTFPLEINRITKVTSKDILPNFSKHLKSIELLQSKSTDVNKFGYTIHWQEYNFQKVGTHRIPDKITVNTLHDYLNITEKEKEYQTFQNNVQTILISLPQLKEWCIANPLKVIEHRTWKETLLVCHYFLKNPRPNLYTRQLPIDIHTKYISDNESIIQSLLEFLIPDSINHNAKKFEEKFNLLFDESLIRIRFLDKSISPIPNISYLSFTISELKTFHPSCKNVFVTENKMNFLTLPNLKDTIAIWSGGGFNVSYLKEIAWLKEKQFYYWGDIDIHGFEILHQFRSYFNNTIAVMMNQETFSKYYNLIGKGKPSNVQDLSNLTESEYSLYQLLKEKNLRLEQEKIPQSFADRTILEIINFFNII